MKARQGKKSYGANTYRNAGVATRACEQTTRKSRRNLGYRENSFRKRDNTANKKLSEKSTQSYPKGVIT